MNLKNPLSWISLGFGSGLSPIAPGTIGSFFALIIYAFFFDSLLTSWMNHLVFLLFIAGSFLIGVYIYPRTVEEENDPGSFVWDEFVGMWVACLPLSFIGSSLFWLCIAFFLFRLFDIWKPLGIKSFDAKHGAFYVMIDDVLAGFYASILVIFLSIFFL
ncbi:MAG: phosphatidylglycerophosphatase A [SAR86 cluster bacterium]|jgi:phosphatidylglycerophosphatase A|nr:phosphatidylglycerophosphatase A [SAR86 cluster bacterium]|tara:strand:+ start:431 stop:907 length:477 start_codon:yes stop_codon:yes gene_type:complete